MSPHPPYTGALKQILRPNVEHSAAAFIAGNLNVNSWGKEFQEWVETADLWELTDTSTSTFEAGTAGDAILMAAGAYIPEGVLPKDEENMKD